jgi:hypothetical protein
MPRFRGRAAASYPHRPRDRGHLWGFGYETEVIKPIIHDELIDEIEKQIRKCGGAWSEWCVGTAKDSRGPFFRRHLAIDLGDGLAYREAFTTSAAQTVVSHMVNDRGLEFGSASVAGPGKIVFLYRKPPPARTAPGSDDATFSRRAA